MNLKLPINGDLIIGKILLALGIIATHRLTASFSMSPDILKVVLTLIKTLLDV